MIWPANEVRTVIVIEQFYSFFEIHHEYGFHFWGETHNFWECVYVLSGRICVSAEDRVYTLESGEIIFHKPMEFHKFYVESTQGATLLIFSFSLEGAFRNILKNKVYFLSEEEQQLINTMHNYARRQASGCNIPDNSLKEHSYLLPSQKNPAYLQTLTTYLYQLILSLIGEGTVAEVSSAPDALTFSKAVKYMHAHITGQPGVLEIASHCNISEATLKRIFDKYAGLGIHKYFLKLKINMATELLADGVGVSETAERLGFSSQSYFSVV